MSLTEQIQHFIQTDPRLHEDILLLRVIDFVQLYQRLHAAGIKCTKPHLMHYLDKAGVSYSQQGSKNKSKANGKQAARGID